MPESRSISLSVLTISICFVLSAPSAVLAAPDCGHWVKRIGVDAVNVDVFWQTASTDDVIRCVTAGADPNERSEEGRAPLHHAGNADTVMALVRAGADPNVRDKDCRAPLHFATNSGTVTALVETGADPDAQDEKGLTPLMVAAIDDNLDVVEALVEAGADVNVQTAPRPCLRKQNLDQPLLVAA